MTMHLPSDDPLETYRAVEDCSALMLSAARAQDWHLVDEARAQCDRLIGTLRQSAALREWPTERQKARLKILHRVLRNEAELRRLTFPGADRLDRLMACHS